MALIDNLVSYWKLDEASGNATDAHGTNTLTDNNTVTSAVGKINDARVFARANSESLTTTTMPTTSLPLSISGWIFPTTLTASTTYNSIGGGTNASNNNAWGLATEGAKKLDFYASDGSGTFIHVTGTTVLNVSTWYHIVLVWRTATDYEIYVNAASEGTGTTSRSPNVANNRFAISGYAPSGGDFFEGRIDEVGIWTKSLTTTEISELYNSGNGLAYDFGGGGGGGTIPVLVQQYRRRRAA